MEHFVLSRFWTRIWALLIDAILLGIIGGIILYAGMPFFLKIGGWGRLIGWPIALAYYSIGNSALAGGQTPGKRLMRIEVVDATGAPVPLAVSFKRALIYTGSYFLLGVPFFLDFPLLTLLYQFPLWMLSLGIAIYYIFNRETRQSLHDLAVGTFVVDVSRNEYEDTELWPRTNKPFRIWVGTAIVLLLFFINSGISRNRQTLVKDLVALKGEVETVKKVRTVTSVSYQAIQYITPENPGGAVTYYLIGVEVESPLFQSKYEGEQRGIYKAIARKFLQTRFAENPEQQLTIALVNNADIGIARLTKATSDSRTVAQWRKLVGE